MGLSVSFREEMQFEYYKKWHLCNLQRVLMVYPGVHFGGAGMQPGHGCGSCSLVLEILPSSKRFAICPAPALSI